MTAKLSPAELLRKKLAKRQEQQVALANNITPKSMVKTPSQTRSERLKKKLSRGVVSEAAIINDCFDCPKKPGCAETLVTCPERSVVSALHAMRREDTSLCNVWEDVGAMRDVQARGNHEHRTPRPLG